MVEKKPTSEKKAAKDVNKSEEIRKLAKSMQEKSEKPRPVAIIAARHVSMPSPIISGLDVGAKRTAPPRHGPSIIFGGETGALLRPSRASQVR